MLSLVFIVPIFSPLDIDAIGAVSRIIDGDTFVLSSGERVRLADIDAPESGESGYRRATVSLSSLISGRTIYLDTDGFYGRDRYGRLVCVVYVEYDAIHFINVNKALLMEGCAITSDYPNEFDPYSWSLYSPKASFMPTLILVPIFILIAASSGIVLVIIFIKERKRGLGGENLLAKSYPKFKFSNRLPNGDYLTLAVWSGKKDSTAEVLTIQLRHMEDDDWITAGRLAVYRTNDGIYSKLPERHPKSLTLERK